MPRPASRPDRARRPRRQAAGDVARPRPSAAASAADTTDLAPVLDPDGRALLDEVGARVAGEDPLTASTRLRAARHPPERVAAVLTQATLRRRAAAKLGDAAERMLLTREGLEQATRLPVARLHAARLAGAGVRRVADLGCGLGVDAMAFAEAGLQVTALERDAVVAAAAAVNLAPWPHAQVVAGDAVAWAQEHLDGGGAREDAVWLDPARRQIGGTGTARVFDPEAFSPPLSFVVGLAEAGHTVGVKLGPGIPHTAVPASAEAEWVSVDGDVTEAVLWFGAAARPGVRRAARVLSARDGELAGEELTSEVPAGGSPEVPAVGEEGMAGLVGQVLHEPDGAVIRAGLVTDLAVRWDAQGAGPVRQLDPHLAYLVAPDAVVTPLARAYRIHAVHDFHVKALRRWARETGVGRLDVKKRGMAVTPEEVRRQVLGAGGKGGGGRHATLVLARVGQRRFALEVTPLG